MLAYYYHEHSDSVFVDHLHTEFGPVEGPFIMKIGLCFHGTYSELMKRFLARKKRWGGMPFKLKGVTIDFSKPILPF